MNVFRTFGLALAASTLCACSANHNAIYRHDTLNPDQSAIITVDAKQRAILVGDHRTTEAVSYTHLDVYKRQTPKTAT